MGWTRLSTISVALALVAATCGEGSEISTDHGERPSVPASAAHEATSRTRPPPTPAGPGATEQPTTACERTDPPHPDAAPFVEGPSVPVEALQAAGDAGPRVEAAVYPRPEYPGQPWSQWGQGVVLSDGRFLSAIGDHRGADGNSYLYEYDPASRQLTQVGDVLSLVDHHPGAWGYGKVHAQLVQAPCGVYAVTYWGTRRNLTYGDGYRGDVLLHVDPVARTVTSLGTLIEQHGVPSLAGWAGGGLLYGEAVEPSSDPNRGPFFVYDTRRGEVVYRTEDVSHVGFRSILVDSQGRAHFSAGDHRLHVYDPHRGEIERRGVELPGRWLRAATVPAPDGTVYGVTREPDVLFALEPDGQVRQLGSVRGYTTSVALSPDGESLYYVPGAHGDAWNQGTPLIEVDTTTGRQRVVVELNPLSEEAFGLRLGGTYNVAIDPSGDRVYVGLNAGRDGESFGEVVLAVVHLR